MEAKANDKEIDVRFEYLDKLPEKPLNRRINIKALIVYGLYRNTLFDSYKDKQDCAKDIRNFRRIYDEKAGSKLFASARYQSAIYHYSVNTSVNTMKKWRDSQEPIQCYLAYSTVKGENRIVGFVHFKETTPNNVYIAQLGVLVKRKGIGRCLMECVLNHYPADTPFSLVTRKFNTEATILYGKRLGFSEISEDDITQLGFDDRYCGYSYTQ